MSGWIHDRLVDPAHAGMNLSTITAGMMNRGGPRACGDEPNPLYQSHLYDDVDPAHAGMNLRKHCPVHSGKRGPRACGDEPGIPDQLEGGNAWTPRMRG